MSIEDVSVLVEYGGVQTIEIYCAPWDRSRRDGHAPIIRNAHNGDSLLAELYVDSARSAQIESVRVRKPMISGDVRPIRRSLPIVSAG